LRYLFRGLIRETGKPVVGHVEADTEETAFNALADNGIVTESLSPDPKPNFPAPNMGQAPRFADALDSAFDASAHQIAFDDLTERYRGKRVWVIDRDKIRRRVSQVVDEAMQEAQSELDNDTQTRERVAKAIEGLFKDSKNITSPQTLAPPPPPQPPVHALPAPPANYAAGPVAGGPVLDAQIDRLANLITTAETVLASIQAAARNASFGRGGGGGGEGGGGGRRRGRASKMKMTDNDVLLEIFKSNMQLQRGITPPPRPPSVAEAGEAPAVEIEIEEMAATEAPGEGPVVEASGDDSASVSSSEDKA
jgi:hypothetical protein